MGNDFGCICSKDTGDVPVPNSDYKFDNNPDIVQNDEMKQSVKLSQQVKAYTSRAMGKVKKIQKHYLAHYVKRKFRSGLQERQKIFDSKIKNLASIIDNDPNNNEINKYAHNAVKEIEKNLIPFVPSNTEISRYKYVFQRNALLFNSNSSIYKGNWNYDGQKHGFGIYVDEQGNKYIGFWEKDYFNGRGRLIDNRGNCFDGMWKKGKANGAGILTLANGYKYDGQWVDDRQQGKGIEHYSDNDKYEGEFQSGFKNGDGVYTWSDGSEYRGKFDFGVINGKGHFLWKDGRCYEGQWSNGQMEGKGEFKWPNGKKYIGEYKHSMKNGYGTFYWNESTYYEGNWVNNNQHGEGEYVDNGKRIKGVFRYGKLIKSDVDVGELQVAMKKTMKEYMDKEDNVIPEVHDSFQMES